LFLFAEWVVPLGMVPLGMVPLGMVPLGVLLLVRVALHLPPQPPSGTTGSTPRRWPRLRRSRNRGHRPQWGRAPPRPPEI